MGKWWISLTRSLAWKFCKFTLSFFHFKLASLQSDTAFYLIKDSFFLINLKNTTGHSRGLTKNMTYQIFTQALEQVKGFLYRRYYHFVLEVIVNIPFCSELYTALLLFPALHKSHCVHMRFMSFILLQVKWIRSNKIIKSLLAWATTITTFLSSNDGILHWLNLA